MKDNKNGTTEVFAIWEYDSYEQYKRNRIKRLEMTRSILEEYMNGMKNMAEENMFYRST